MTCNERPVPWLRKEEHEALQLKLVAAQDCVHKKALQILCLEEDILELKKFLLSCNEPPAPADGLMPEAMAIQAALASMGDVLAFTQTWTSAYGAYVAAETASGRQPLEATCWISQETANVARSCVGSLAQLQQYQAELSSLSRPRKTARLDGASQPAAAAANAWSP